MTVTDCLKVVAMETGEVILPDASVDGAVGSIHVTKDSIPDILNIMKNYEPGLTWQIVYYPGGANEPAGEDLYKAIQLLQGLDLDGLVIPPSGDDKLMLSLKKQSYTTPAQEQANEAGFRAYYLVSDPAERAQQAKNAKPTNTPPVLAPDKSTHFVASLNDIQNQIAQMNPQQQVQALNEMAAVSRQINESLSPQVLATLKSQNAAQHTPPNLSGLPGTSK
jgi:hypothetical protein